MYVKSKWEKEANITLTDEEWLNICKTHVTTSCSGQWGEFVWKNLIRFFITPKIKHLQSGKPGCGHYWRRCENSLANHQHKSKC